jgi:hydroxylamine reductase
MNMFCYQCQEAAKNTGCTVAGACGKPADVANLQDLLIWLLKGISFWGVRGRGMGVNDSETNLFIAKALFSTITNVNFDADRFVAWINEAITLRDNLRVRAQMACEQQHGKPCGGGTPEMTVWKPETGSMDELVRKGFEVGIMSDPNLNPDIRSLRELLVIGLKGLAAYTDHAYVLDKTNDELLYFMQEALNATIEEKTADELVGLVLKCGEMGVNAMALLDEANTSRYGHPEPTMVNLGVREGPAILVSGHDLLDLEELLEQTRNKGVNIYTHGEMLPANAYPAFKKYEHFVGNYGSSWWHQQDEFEKFGGAILMTTNCVVKPRDSYKDRLFTTSLVGWQDVKHIADRKNGGTKDFSPLIQKALQSGSPQELEQGTIPIGFAREAVMSVADKVIEAVKSGDIKKFVVMGGCDGLQNDRSYYTEVAQQLPKDHVILTAGCAKYRYNKLDLGDIGGIPRILDAGQCNDSYSLAYIALQLKEAFGLDDINDLPIEYDIAWYEQKAVIVLLALLSLGVKNIRLGPTLPAFVSPNVLNVLVENFNIMPISTVEEDVAAMSA